MCIYTFRSLILYNIMFIVRPQYGRIKGKIDYNTKTCQQFLFTIWRYCIFIGLYLHKLSHVRGYRAHYLSNELLGNISIGSCVSIKAQCLLVISTSRFAQGLQKTQPRFSRSNSNVLFGFFVV